VTAGALIISAAALMAMVGLTAGGLGVPATRGLRGDFYRVLPHDVMVGLFGTVFLLAIGGPRDRRAALLASHAAEPAAGPARLA